MPRQKKQADLSADLMPDTISLPPTVFMYTVPQIKYMLQCSDVLLRQHILYYVGRDFGKMTPHKMRCVNIAPPDQQPQWRVEETEFIRWMKAKKIYFKKQQVR